MRVLRSRVVLEVVTILEEGAGEPDRSWIAEAFDGANEAGCYGVTTVVVCDWQGDHPEPERDSTDIDPSATIGPCPEGPPS